MGHFLLSKETVCLVSLKNTTSKSYTLFSGFLWEGLPKENKEFYLVR